MPIYTYECENCGVRFEAKQSFSDMPLTVCPECEGHIHRVIQPVGVVFKGSGFYVTDNRGKQSLATPGSKKDDSKSSESGSSENSSSSSNESASSTESDKSNKSDKPAKTESESKSTAKTAEATPAKSTTEAK